MARSTIWPEPQADGDLSAALGWSFPFSGSGHLNLEEIDGWISTDGTDTTTHSAQVTHGITTTGDWQISYLADSVSAADFGVLICDGSFNGYWVRFGTLVSVRPVTGGGPGAVIASASRTAAAHVPAFIECTYVAATDTFTVYEDGVSRATGTNTLYEATAKTLLIPIATQSAGIRNRCQSLFIQDYIDVQGHPPVAPIPNPVWRSSLALR